MLLEQAYTKAHRKPTPDSDHRGRVGLVSALLGRSTGRGPQRGIRSVLRHVLLLSRLLGVSVGEFLLLFLQTVLFARRRLVATWLLVLLVRTERNRPAFFFSSFQNEVKNTATVNWLMIECG
jgi:hypothetical protein